MSNCIECELSFIRAEKLNLGDNELDGMIPSNIGELMKLGASRALLICVVESHQCECLTSRSISIIEQSI